MNMRITEQDFKTLKNFGAHLRRYREQSGRGLNEVAREAGVAPSFLSQVERGQYKRPSAETMEALFKALRYPSNSRHEFFAEAGMVTPEIAAVFRKHPDEFALILLSLKDLKKSEVGCFADQIERYIADAKQVTADEAMRHSQMNRFR